MAHAADGVGDGDADADRWGSAVVVVTVVQQLVEVDGVGDAEAEVRGLWLTKWATGTGSCAATAMGGVVARDAARAAWSWRFSSRRRASCCCGVEIGEVRLQFRGVRIGNATAVYDLGIPIASLAQGRTTHLQMRHQSRLLLQIAHAPQTGRHLVADRVQRSGADLRTAAGDAVAVQIGARQQRVVGGGGGGRRMSMLAGVGGRRVESLAGGQRVIRDLRLGQRQWDGLSKSCGRVRVVFRSGRSDAGVWRCWGRSRDYVSL